MTPEGPAAALLVATDLDGCLLDEQTYSYEPAQPALAALAARGIPLVLASSKTRAEMVPLAGALGTGAPLVVENGGALLVPAGHLGRPPDAAVEEGGFWTIVLGVPRAVLVRALAEIAAATGARIRSFADLGDEVAALTGLPPEAAARARAREYDEPFLLEDASGGFSAAINDAARARGLVLTRGGRFWHLGGDTDKGRALARLRALYASEGRRFSIVALGDSPNDVPLLRAADRPIVIPRPDGRADADVSAALPFAERAPAPGPAGWNAAVLAVLAGQRLPQVA